MSGIRLTKPVLSPWLWGIGITALLLLPLPTGAASRRWPALVNELIDFSHPVAFGWLAHLLYLNFRARSSRPFWVRGLWVLTVIAGYGTVTELLQLLAGRQASVIDFRNDMLGAVFAMLVHACRSATATTSRIVIAALAALVGAAAMATLAFTLAAYVHRGAAAPAIWRPDSRLFGRFSHSVGAPVPLLAVREPMSDWRGMRHLEIDIENPGDEDHPVIVRVHDLWHDLRHEDRFNRRFELPPHSRQTLTIPLQDIRLAPVGRQLDMRRIRGIVVFSVAEAPSQEFLVHEIRLSR